MKKRKIKDTVLKGRRLMKKIAHLLMGRLTIVGVSILLQICWLFLVLWKFSYQFTYAKIGRTSCREGV